MDALLAKLGEKSVDELDLQSLLKQGSELSAKEDFWMQLSTIAIKKRDLDVVLFCVTKMKMARAARDARRLLVSSKTHHEALASLSMNLGMVDEAIVIIKESGDEEALCRVYQEMNNWTEAIETAGRMNLQTVYYNYAKKLEADGNFTQAIKYYELSNTHTFEVPRMLYTMDTNNTSLRAYCNKDLPKESDSNCSVNSQIQLYKWWAQFCESIGEMDEAAAGYTRAQDYYNLVRLLCFTGQREKAQSLVESLMSQNLETNSPERRNLDAALLFLGKQLEGTNPSDSIAYFLACGAIKHALKTCKNAAMVNEMVKIIVTYGSKEDAKGLIAKYLRGEEANEISAASMIRLYHKCGLTSKAVRKAIESRNWGQLREIIAEEAEKTSGEQGSISESAIQDALEALRNDSEIVDIVIDLILMAKNSQEFLLENIIQEYNIQVDETLIDRVEKLTASRGSNEKLISSLADLSLKQGKYFIAAKLFNSTGDRINSIKALIRSGDTDKVIKYANIARNKGVYKMAANYLQTVDFTDRQLVASFYKKASASEELARYQGSSSSVGQKETLASLGRGKGSIDLTLDGI